MYVERNAIIIKENITWKYQTLCKMYAKQFLEYIYNNLLSCCGVCHARTAYFFKKNNVYFKGSWKASEPKRKILKITSCISNFFYSIIQNNYTPKESHFCFFFFLKEYKENNKHSKSKTLEVNIFLFWMNLVGFMCCYNLPFFKISSIFYTRSSRYTAVLYVHWQIEY